MSAVTASIVVGSKHRSDPGIQPRWLLLLHEGQSYAWHLVKLQLTLGDLATTGPDDPPGVLWRAGSEENLLGEMALLIHLYAARTPEIVHAAARIEAIRKNRVDLGGLPAGQAQEFETLRGLALQRGRELTLAATILPGSRLTEDALLDLPDWELNVSHTAVTRDWAAGEHRLIVTDYRQRAAAEDGRGAEFASGRDGQGDCDGVPRSQDDGFWEGVSGVQGWRPATVGADAGGAHQTPAQPGQEPSQTRTRGRFGLRRHRPVIATIERERIGLADFFGRGD